VLGIELLAVLALRLAALSTFAVLGLYLLSGGAVVVIVMHVPVPGRIFGRIRVVRGYSSHGDFLRYR
jgi:hypothetical protein